MTLTTNPALAPAVATLVAAHGLEVLATAAATSKSGVATTRFTLALPSDRVKTLQLELSDDFELGRTEFAEQLGLFLDETARRLQNPQPNAILTLSGLPLSYEEFEWPFHESTAGADTAVVHGRVNLLASGKDDEEPTPLHAKIAAAMTITFREVVRAPEQPFAEGFILNAVRKTLDQGQLELVKSGNRQPVPVTTRYYSARQNRFVFNDTTEAQRRDFLAAKTFWLSGVLGGGAPVWLADPRDTQYLNTTVADLKSSVAKLIQEGLIRLAGDTGFASATPALMARRTEYNQHLIEALAFIKPTFNEEMRGGHTNM